MTYAIRYHTEPGDPASLYLPLEAGSPSRNEAERRATALATEAA